MGVPGQTGPQDQLVAVEPDLEQRLIDEPERLDRVRVVAGGRACLPSPDPQTVWPRLALVIQANVAPLPYERATCQVVPDGDSSQNW